MGSKQKPVDAARSRLETKLKDVKDLALNMHKLIDNMIKKSVSVAEALLEEKSKAKFLAKYPEASRDLESSLSQLLLASDKLSGADGSSDTDSATSSTADAFDEEDVGSGYSGKPIQSPTAKLKKIDAAVTHSPVPDPKQSFRNSSSSSLSSCGGTYKTLDAGLQVKPFPWQEGIAYQVSVTHAKNPWDFSVQVWSSAVMDLMDHMCVHFSKQASSGYKGGINKIPSVGHYCCAKSPEDGTWYRAKIWQVFTNGAQVPDARKYSGSGASSYGEDQLPGVTAKVLLIDEGTEIVVDMASICPLNPKFAQVPAQSVRCLLSGVQPAVRSLLSKEFNFDELYDAWSSDATSWFQDMVASENRLTAFFSLPPQYLEEEPHFIDPHHVACDLYVTGGQFRSMQSTGRPPIEQHVGYMMLQVMMASMCDVFKSELLTPQSRMVMQNNMEHVAVEEAPFSSFARTPSDPKKLSQPTPTFNQLPLGNDLTSTRTSIPKTASIKDNQSVTQSAASESRHSNKKSAPAGFSNLSLPGTSGAATGNRKPPPLAVDHKLSSRSSPADRKTPATAEDHKIAPRNFAVSTAMERKTPATSGDNHKSSQSSLVSTAVKHKTPATAGSKHITSRGSPGARAAERSSLTVVVPDGAGDAGAIDSVGAMPDRKPGHSDTKDSAPTVSRGSSCPVSSKDFQVSSQKALPHFNASSRSSAGSLKESSATPDNRNDKVAAEVDSSQRLPLLRSLVSDDNKASACGFASNDADVSEVLQLDGQEVSQWETSNLLTRPLRFSADVKFTEKSFDTGVEGFARVLVSHVESPSLFFAHLITPEVSVLDAFLQTLNRFYKCREAEIRSLPLRQFDIGMPVAAKYSLDSIWYRAIIVNMTSNENDGKPQFENDFSSPATLMYHVLHVDFGSQEWISAADVLPLADEFLDLPRETVSCCLADVRPPTCSEFADDASDKDGNISHRHVTSLVRDVRMSDGAAQEPARVDLPVDNLSDLGNTKGPHFQDSILSDCWSESAKTRFKDLTLTERPLLASLKSSTTGKRTGSVLHVYLHDTSDGREVCINDSMIAEGLACSTLDRSKDFLPTAEPKEIATKEREQSLSKCADTEAMINHWDPMKDHFNDERNLYSIDSDDAEQAFLGRAKKNHEFCTNFLRFGSCYRGNACKFLHVGPGDPSIQELEVFCDSFSDQVAIPAVGDWVPVVVTAFYDAVHFSVNFPFGTHNLDSLLKDKGRNNVRELEENGDLRCLGDAMREYYSKLSKHSGDLVLPAKGELLAARSAADDMWYRAQTISTDGDRVKIRFVDFGDTASISLGDCHKLQPEFVHLPFQAIECFLANVEIDANFRSDEAIMTKLREEFQRLTEDKILMAQVVSRFSRCIVVDLYDTTIDGQPHINELILQQQGVRPCAMRYPTSDELDLLTDTVSYVPA